MPNPYARREALWADLGAVQEAQDFYGPTHSGEREIARLFLELGAVEAEIEAIEAQREAA